jgi:hypothetical protein
LPPECFASCAALAELIDRLFLTCFSHVVPPVVPANVGFYCKDLESFIQHKRIKALIYWAVET